MKPFILCLCLLFSIPVTVSANPVVSTNIPLDSYIYTYLDKLDGLGYIQEMRIGTKPYTRIQAAKWVKQALENKKATTGYLESMLITLQKDLQPELAYLDGRDIQDKIAIKEWSIGETYYDGKKLANYRSHSHYQPLHINQNGYDLAQNQNETMRLRVEKALDHDFVFSMTPRFDTSEDNTHLSFESAYLKTHINNVEISLGKDALWWGQGARGTLALSNQATPQTYVQIKNIEPVNLPHWLDFLGPFHGTVFYSQLNDMQKFDGSTLKNPSFVGLRADFIPSKHFTFGLSRTSIVDDLNQKDMGNFLTGQNAESAGADKWNAIAGLDFRWKLPDIQLYGELYGEDQSHLLGFIPAPSKVAYTAGLYLPRLTRDGSWDITLEYGKTSDVWYNHWVFRDGYVDDQHVLGDAMGNNASRYYGKLTHYFNQADQISLHYERLQAQELKTAERQIDSLWLTSRSRLEDDFYVHLTAGLARIEDYDCTKEHAYLLGLSLVKYY